MDDPTTQTSASTADHTQVNLYQLRGHGDTTGRLKSMTAFAAAAINSGREDGKLWTLINGKNDVQVSPPPPAAQIATSEQIAAPRQPAPVAVAPTSAVVDEPKPAAASELGNGFELVELDRIVVPSGRIPLGNVDAIADSFGDLGQLQPIGLRHDEFENTLILMYGATRLAAAGKLGWKTIAAKIVETDDLRAQLSEIDENLIRGRMTALQEAESLKRRKEIYETLHPETKQHVAGSNSIGRNDKGTFSRDSTASADLALAAKQSFADDTAEKSGISKRSVQASVEVASKLDPDAADAIRSTPTADNKSALKQLADAPAAKQRKAAKKLASGESKTVTDALKDEPSDDAPALPVDPIDEFVAEMQERISELRSFASRLRSTLQYDAKADGSGLKRVGAHYYSRQGTIDDTNKLIRNLEAGLPADRINKAPGYISAGLKKERERTSQVGGAK